MQKYVERFYRGWTGAKDLVQFEAKIRESDLFILADRNLEREAVEALISARSPLESFITRNPRFERTHKPFAVEPDAPHIIKEMAGAGKKWNVGPMAAVAGAIAESVGRRLLEYSSAVVVENGGDIFALAPRPVRFALFAGDDSPFSGKIIFEVNAEKGVGVCTSSGIVGPSFSYGAADAVVAIASSAADADAAATAIANVVNSPEDVDRVIENADYRNKLLGLIAARADRLGVWGDLRIIG
jgi:hypothetical protein